MLCTPVAVAWALEAEGAKEAVPLAAEADGLWDESVLCAEAADREAAADCGVLRAELRPEAACEADCEVACAMVWLACACAPVACTDVVAACDAEAGERDPALPAACTAAEGLVLLAAEADWVLVDCGVLRTALLLAAEEALGWALAALMLWLETACAPLVCTEALALAAEGERLALSPAALGAEAEAWAAAEDCAAACGLLRAELRPEADCALGWVAAWLMVWLVSERAWPAMTLALACEALGAKEALLAAPAELGAAEEAVLPEADWEVEAAF